MTPAQQSALEFVAGRALTQAEIDQIEPLLPNRNDVEIAAVINAGQPQRRQSITVETMFNVLYSTGDYASLKQAQLGGNPLAVLAFGFLADAKTLGPGRVDLDAALTVAQLDALQSAGLLSQAGRDALDAAGWADADPIHYNKISDALNIAEGRMVL
jgi:hypothetical protein